MAHDPDHRVVVEARVRRRAPRGLGDDALHGFAMEVEDRRWGRAGAKIAGNAEDEDEAEEEEGDRSKLRVRDRRGSGHGRD